MVVINIDTSKDSQEEIRKVIKYLQTVVGESTSYESSGEPVASEGIFNLFGNDDTSNSTDEPKPDESDDRSEDGSDDETVIETNDDAYIEVVEY